ncbi:MAG TPA: hypothetical protein VI172_14060 [Candidatus Dormibacteraeota bacterium]
MSDESEIRQAESHRADTFSAPSMPGMEDCVTTTAVATHASEDLHPVVTEQRYVASMTTTAHVIAAAFREHLPGLRDRKLHALLYLAQGICLAANQEPLFDEPITTTRIGVLVSLPAEPVDKPLDDAQHAVVRLTLARYGQLPGADLESLIRGQQPWRTAHANDGTISVETLGRWFTAQDESPDGTVSGIPRSQRAHLVSGDRVTDWPAIAPDSPEDIAAFIADVKSRM